MFESTKYSNYSFVVVYFSSGAPGSYFVIKIEQLESEPNLSCCFLRLVTTDMGEPKE